MDRKRSHIIKHALAVFGEKGFQCATVEEIARRAGYSKSVLYQYFKNKESLFSAVMMETSFYLDVTKGSGEHQTLESSINHIGKSYMKMQPERVSFTRTILCD